MTGDASASAASVIAAPWPLPARSWAARALLVIRNVAYNSRKVAAASQGRGSPRMPGSPERLRQSEDPAAAGPSLSPHAGRGLG